MTDQLATIPDKIKALSQDKIDEFSERAAILEYDANISWGLPKV